MEENPDPGKESAAQEGRKVRMGRTDETRGRASLLGLKGMKRPAKRNVLKRTSDVSENGEGE